MNRAERRTRHKLVVLPPQEARKFFPGLRTAAGQKSWACSCRRGWLSFSASKPTEAFESHVQSTINRKEDQMPKPEGVRASSFTDPQGNPSEGQFLAVTYVVSFEADDESTVEDREATLRSYIIDTLANVRNLYDTNVDVGQASVSSSLTGTVYEV